MLLIFVWTCCLNAISLLVFAENSIALVSESLLIYSSLFLLILIMLNRLLVTWWLATKEDCAMFFAMLWTSLGLLE